MNPTLIEIGGAEFDPIEITSALADVAFWGDYQLTKTGQGPSDYAREHLLMLLSAFANEVRVRKENATGQGGVQDCAKNGYRVGSNHDAV